MLFNVDFNTLMNSIKTTKILKLNCCIFHDLNDYLTKSLLERRLYCLHFSIYSNKFH